MSKLLEELLLKAGALNENVEKHINANQKSVVKNTMKDEVKKFINEAIEAEDDSMDFDEESTDAETPNDEISMDGGEASEETPLDGTETSDDETETPLDIDMGEDMLGSEEEVMDLTNATEEEVLQVLKNLPDDAQIEIVKSPSYNVSVKKGGTPTSLGMDVDSMDVDGMDDDMGDEMEIDGEDEDYGDADFDTDESDMEDSDEDDEMEEGEELEEGVNMPFDNSPTQNVSKGEKTNKPFGKNEKSKGQKVYSQDAKKPKNQMKEACEDDAVYESKTNEIVEENKSLKSRIKQLTIENQKMKATEAKSIAILKEQMKKIKQLALSNSNMAFATKLFSEHSTTGKEKLAILQKFDSAKTLNESKLMYEMLDETLNKKSVKPNINPVIIGEGKEKNKTVITEQVFDEPSNRVMELMNFKSKG